MRWEWVGSWARAWEYDRDDKVNLCWKSFAAKMLADPGVVVSVTRSRSSAQSSHVPYKLLLWYEPKLLNHLARPETKFFFLYLYSLSCSLFIDTHTIWSDRCRHFWQCILSRTGSDVFRYIPWYKVTIFLLLRKVVCGVILGNRKPVTLSFTFCMQISRVRRVAL
jgi:hypothetical protein